MRKAGAMMRQTILEGEKDKSATPIRAQKESLEEDSLSHIGVPVGEPKTSPVGSPLRARSSDDSSDPADVDVLR